MYKCNNCGRTFYEGEEARTRSYLAHKGSEPIYTEEDCCPYCGGDYEELTKCEMCGEYHSEDELECGICDECIEEKRYDIDFCYEISKNEQPESVRINCFLAAMFADYEINEILWDILKERQRTYKLMQSDIMKDLLDCTDFINSDRAWFAEKILEVATDEVK